MISIPTVHLNGTSKDDLIEQNILALRAVRAAIIAVQNAYPNGRDYYVQAEEVQTPGGATFRAQAQHGRRLKVLQEIEKEYEQIVLGIDRQA